MKKYAYLLLVLVVFAFQSLLKAQIDARIMQYPDVSKTQIVFAYAGDLWVVSKDGGVANRLTTPPGPELFPKYSPDGSHIAFSGNYEGNLDVYEYHLKAACRLE